MVSNSYENENKKEKQSKSDGLQISRRTLLGSIPFSLAVGVKSNAMAARGLAKFPPTDGLLNTYHLMCAGQSVFEAENIWETNPLFSTSREGALSPLGAEQVQSAINAMESRGINPSVVKYSLATSSMETTEAIASQLFLGRNRLIPEFTFMDPRAVGEWNELSFNTTREAVWAMDNAEAGSLGTGGLPPPTEDGTPHETIADQVIRLRQLISILETQWSGDTILLVFPDGSSPAVLTCLFGGIPLNRAHEIEFSPGEIRFDITMSNAINNFPSQPTAEYTKALERGELELKRLRTPGEPLRKIQIKEKTGIATESSVIDTNNVSPRTEIDKKNARKKTTPNPRIGDASNSSSKESIEIRSTEDKIPKNEIKSVNVDKENARKKTTPNPTIGDASNSSSTKNEVKSENVKKDGRENPKDISNLNNRSRRSEVKIKDLSKKITESNVKESNSNLSSKASKEVRIKNSISSPSEDSSKNLSKQSTESRRRESNPDLASKKSKEDSKTNDKRSLSEVKSKNAQTERIENAQTGKAQASSKVMNERGIIKKVQKPSQKEVKTSSEPQAKSLIQLFAGAGLGLLAVNYFQEDSDETTEPSEQSLANNSVEIPYENAEHQLITTSTDPSDLSIDQNISKTLDSDCEVSEENTTSSLIVSREKKKLLDTQLGLKEDIAMISQPLVEKRNESNLNSEETSELGSVFEEEGDQSMVNISRFFFDEQSNESNLNLKKSKELGSVFEREDDESIVNISQSFVEQNIDSELNPAEATELDNVSEIVDDNSLVNNTQSLVEQNIDNELNLGEAKELDNVSEIVDDKSLVNNTQSLVEQNIDSEVSIQKKKNESKVSDSVIDQRTDLNLDRTFNDIESKGLPTKMEGRTDLNEDVESEVDFSYHDFKESTHFESKAHLFSNRSSKQRNEDKEVALVLAQNSTSDETTKLTVTNKAMQDYLDQDDGADEWLGMLSSLMEEDS